MYTIDKKIKSILYVEDEKGARGELANVVELFCNNLYLACDGKDGLEQFKKYKPQIVISDIKMPNMDGIEMVKAIKDLEPEVKVIFTTAFSDTNYLHEAIELQVDGYILKPIDLELLEKKIISIISNIKLQEELLEKEQLLMQHSKMATLGEMIVNITHHWRQPLNVISLIASNLLFKKDLDEVSDEVIDKSANQIMEQVEYLSKTFDSLKSFTGSISMEKDEYKISELIEKATEFLKISIDEEDILIVKQIDSKLENIEFTNYLLQVFINLFNNSIDAFNKESNKVDKLIINISVKQKEDKTICIEIKDNMGGIDENIIDKVFEPYFTTKHQSQGTGLGLYTIYQIIINKLNGTIRVYNEEFEFNNESYTGAKFRVVLPKGTIIF